MRPASEGKGGDGSVKRARNICWAVFTSDRESALEIISNIVSASRKEVILKIISLNRIEINFVDGTRLWWLRPVEATRGHIYNILWCDCSIGQRMIDSVILPGYLGTWDDIVWFCSSRSNVAS